MSEAKKSWVVRMRCEVIKEVITEPCTYQEAHANPWDHVEGGETEIEQVNWEVQSVKENQ